ncbi:cadherin-23-like [Ylistrum balloti]|uniref:cadherin-23-like n=1 Tax=Ylistrum balloti TaxID=509963 RepID=UPI002905EB36|nr:cadherin-23-like [Ylistrum balloti]
MKEDSVASVLLVKRFQTEGQCLTGVSASISSSCPCPTGLGSRWAEDPALPVLGGGDAEKAQACQEEVVTMLAKGTVEEVPMSECTPGFYSRMFLVRQKSGAWGPIIDLSAFNRHVDSLHFKMETPQVIMAFVGDGIWATSVDLKYAFFHIPIKKSARKFLRFTCNGWVFKFGAMPFAPLVFTKLLHVVVGFLHSHGIDAHIYFNDSLMLHLVRESCGPPREASHQTTADVPPVQLGSVIQEVGGLDSSYPVCQGVRLLMDHSGERSLRSASDQVCPLYEHGHGCVHDRMGELTSTTNDAWGSGLANSSRSTSMCGQGATEVAGASQLLTFDNPSVTEANLVSGALVVSGGAPGYPHKTESPSPAAGNANNPPRLLNFSQSRVIVRGEDTALNTTIGTLTAVDSDGPSEILFDITDSSTSQLVRLSEARGASTVGRSVDIILISPLDRDREPSERKMYFSVADGESPQEHNTVMYVTLFIRDVNDEVPEFSNLRYKASVAENATIGVTVSKVTATDPDNGPGGTVIYSMQPVAQAADSEYKNAFRIDPNNGEIIVNSPLDYEKHNFYEFVITAVDGLGKPCKDNADFVVTIVDVQDTPPSFFNLPYSVSMMENAAKGEQVLQVTALDGDRDERIRNNLRYSFLDGDYQNFALNSTTGWITVKNELDRDNPIIQQRGGVYAFSVEATEIVNPGDFNVGSINATTLVTITVRDVNDNPPTFTETSYDATILENMQDGVPVSFIGSTKFMSVSDKDQGKNSYFVLSLQKDGQPYHDFAPLPSEVFSESTILIRVNNSSNLDYEKMTSVNFQIIAMEVDTSERRSSTADITVHIEDMNDNPPVFDQSVYSASVQENIQLGFTVMKITASDDDSGIFGLVTYSLRGGNGRFDINEQTGVVTVDGLLDRETVEEYYLTVEAKDGGGFRSTAELRVNITDKNDMIPTFRRDEYFSSVKENNLHFIRGPLFVEAFDDDQPGTNNSEVRYRIVDIPSGLNNNFTINSTSGEVAVTSPLDYEKLDPDLKGKVLLKIEAYDLGVPQKQRAIPVTIEVEDENDNAPIFAQSIYTADVMENATEGTMVIQVHATDADGTDLNHQFLYRIDSGAQDKFRIDFQTGNITVEKGAKLDRETLANYTLIISATDRGIKSLVEKCEVKVTIIDINDELPVFSPLTKSVSVLEDSGLNEVVTRYAASDADVNHKLRYSVIPGSVRAVDENSQTVDIHANNIQNYFTVLPDTGDVVVKSPLDRETAERVVLEILVEDVNAWHPSIQNATATLTIDLIDVNDNYPKFVPSSMYKVNISEGRDINDFVTMVIATDADENQQLQYFIGEDISSSFKIMDPTAGQILLKKKLDREKAPTVEFKVIVVDNGSPTRLSSTANVVVTVVDINDNPPVFYPHFNILRVPEDASNNTVIATINAYDVDTGIFGQVFYALKVSPDDHNFAINEVTGEISVEGSLDREHRPSGYSIEVTATNRLDPDNQLSNSTGIIHIEILDINDNNPDITSTQGILKSLKEDERNGTEVCRIQAQDPDQGINGTVAFSLTADSNTTGGFAWFAMSTVLNTATGQNEGVMTLRESILDRVGEFYVTVRASDLGIPAQFSEKQLMITVKDVNRDQPTFVKPARDSEVVFVKEEQEGAHVMFVKAIDNDHGENGRVRYNISHVKDYIYFKLDEDSGQLTINGTLDREDPTHQGKYQIKINAFDNGYPKSYIRSTNLIIQLLDVNDQDPVFERIPSMEPFVLGPVLEEQSVAFVGYVNVSTDADTDVNFTKTCYHIVGGTMMDYFHLNVTGGLFIKKVIDREGGINGQPIDTVDLVVWATPLCYLDTGVISRRKRSTDLRLAPLEYDPRNTTLLWVQVNIGDINDHAPRFKEPVLSIGVSRKTQLAEIIYKLHNDVVDEDIGKNRVHRYHMNSITFSPYPGSSNQQQASINSSFYLFPNNGTIKTSTYFRSDLSGYYLMNVSVMDTVAPFFSSNALIRISLINDNQRVKVIFRSSVEEVKNISSRFRDDLERITGYRIVVDQIQTHENTQGKPEVDKTDMFIHAEDKATNTIIEPSELLSKIDAHAAELIGVLNEYNILQIVPTTQEEEEDDSKRLLVMSIVLIAIILGIPCLVLAIVLHIVRKQYQRKLKAATAMAYGSKDSDMQKLEMPGTNMHAYENANPIFMEKVLLEDAGEVEDNDSIDNNAVDPAQIHPYDVQERSLNFLGEYDKTTTFGPPDMNLTAALKAHEDSKIHKTNGQANNHKPMNGHVDKTETNGMDTLMLDGLKTTEI